MARLVSRLSKVSNFLMNEDLDVPGEDIPGLERYPETRRISSSSLDNGVINVSYSLDNKSCIPCVVSFYKEKLLNRGWQLGSESHLTKEEFQQNIALNIEAMKNQFEKANLSTEQRDILSNKFEQLKSFVDKDQDNYVGPEEMTSLNFNRKKEMCMVAVSYVDLNKIYSKAPPEESRENIEKNLQSLPERVANKIKRLMGVGIDEAITITITYIPSDVASGRQKTWF